ncbi:MAG: polysaccharide pyruvyl transferase family protein [Phycisphaerales bacterium]|nr:polysaccharide pyruvyl transferase family protein [Phycisphaerales bacterium]
MEATTTTADRRKWSQSARPSAPRATLVRQYLSGWRGAKIYRVPLVDEKGVPVGNNGDRLMLLGTDVVFRDLGLSSCERPEDADLIVFASSGGMLEKMQRIPHLFRTLCAQFPATPMCVLPSSYLWGTRPFRGEIGQRTAPTVLFCREAHSFRHLTRDHGLAGVDPERIEDAGQSDDGVGVVLDPDMAFELESEAVVMDRRDAAQSTVVMVERTDVEHVSVGMNSKKLGVRKKIARYTPAWLKRAVYPAVNAARATRRTTFREHCEALLREHCPEAVDLKRDIADVSNVNTCSFESFCDRIAAARVVFTTRLHAGIFGAMLGRRTFVFEGSYHKVRGIYEMSMADRECVTFVSDRPAAEA